MRFKRTFDLVAAMLGLIVASPFLVIAAVVVKLTSPGPAFHRARRVGRNGEEFTVLKFRTMRVSDDVGTGITHADDPRITGVGKVLRRLKLDELPQLINVVRGEMSLVGPRPEDPRYVSGYTEEQRRILALRPGVTSPASIAYRDEERLIRERGGDVATVYREEFLPAKLAIDLEYIEGRSFLGDLAVIIRTLFGVVFGSKR